MFRSEVLDAWVLTRYAEVRAAYEDEARLVSPKEGPGSPPYGPAMLQWRGHEHQRKGGIVARDGCAAPARSRHWTTSCATPARAWSASCAA